MLSSDLPNDALFIQLSEECGELVQAAMKLVRHHYCVGHGMNPFTDEPLVLENNLVEELADVLVVMDAIFAKHPIIQSKVGEVRHAKEIRWYERLNRRNDE